MKYVVFALLVGVLLFFIVRSVFAIVKDVKRIKEKKKEKECKEDDHIK